MKYRHCKAYIPCLHTFFGICKIYQYPKVTKITCHNVLQLLLYCCSIFMICMPELYLLSGNINTYTTSSFGVYIVARKIYRVQKFNGYDILYYHRWNSHILLKKLLNGIRPSKKKKHCWQVLFEMSSSKCNLKLKPFEN